MAKIIGGTTTTPIKMPNMDAYATTEYVDDALASLPSGGGETWELIRDDTLTEEVNKVETRADFPMRKFKIMIFSDTTQGVYSNAVVRFMCYSPRGYRRFIYSNNALPTTNGKYGKAVCHGEIADSVLYAQTSFNNTCSASYTEDGDPAGNYANIGVQLNGDSIVYIAIEANVPLHAGTRIVMWGVRA